METIAMGKHGAIVVPNRLRKRYRLEEGTSMHLEELEDGIVIRPISTTIVKSERLAELLINNVLTEEGYLEARRCVGKAKIDQDSECRPLPAEEGQPLLPQPAQVQPAEEFRGLGPEVVQHLHQPVPRWFNRLRGRRIT